LRLRDARALVTTSALYRLKVQELPGRLPGREHVLLVGDRKEIAEIGDVANFHALMEAASDSFEIPATGPEEMALLLFTSGTTGAPKGAFHVHEAVVAHRETARTVLGLRDGDVFWCAADPGWVTSTSDVIIAPLTLGVANARGDGLAWGVLVLLGGASGCSGLLRPRRTWSAAPNGPLYFREDVTAGTDADDSSVVVQDNSSTSGPTINGFRFLFGTTIVITQVST
jgi:acyl-CoA synthetase (AMP-forming)/AMP-acid ligase II